MLFNSHAFIFVFLPVALALWYGLARLRAVGGAVAALVVASCVFYAHWNWRFLPVLGLSVAFNYVVGRRLAEHPDKRVLAFGVAANLLVLGYFKYANFFLENLEWLAGTPLARLDVVLPLGISFITFQKIAFLVDSHRGHVTGYRLRDFLLFVTFFPQLIAGPIVHHSQFIPQLQRLRIFVVDHRNLALGAFLFSAGLFKKVAIADSLAPWATPAFDQGAALGLADAWAASLAYALQLYYDFSGYSEMALGLALLFNLKLPLNFDSPYQAVSIVDFWRRWHITLSTWFNDYVFMPLAYAFKAHGKLGVALAALVTFFLSGLWHGAGWTFVAYGTLHGVAVAWEALTRAKRKAVAARVPKRAWLALGRAATFVFVVVGFVFFRAPDFAAVGRIVGGMAGLGGLAATNAAYKASGLHAKQQLVVLAALLAWVWFAPNAPAMAQRLRPGVAWAAATAGLFLAGVLLLDRPTVFIYFQF